jgi:acetolactate synthase-1/2/3 large subunit
MNSPRSAARILVDQWLVQGVNHVFCVPGEAHVPVLDVLLGVPSVRLVVNRHESGSTFMAMAYARLAGQPGVALVSRAPGAANALAGVLAARQDSLPLILFVTTSALAFSGREAFQEFDPVALFGVHGKRVEVVTDPGRIPEVVARAFQVATSGRPGPVVVALPEDLLEGTASVPDARCHTPVQSAPSDTQMAALRRTLRAAQRPILLLGGSGWTTAACDNVRDFAEANALPVACAFRRQDLFDNQHPCYAGDAGLGMSPRLAQRILEADLVLAFGTRLGEVASGAYELLRPPVPDQELVHAHAGAEEPGSVLQAGLMICTGMPQLASRLAMSAPVEDPPWREATAQAHAQYAEWQQRPPALAQLAPALDPWAVVRHLREALPLDAVVVNGAGNFAAWLHRFFSWRTNGTQLAPTSGAMGYALPAAVAARIAAPDKVVACITGDGDFLMGAHELATAARHGAGILVIVFNNGMYGTIRMHQERHAPGRPNGTALVNPDFCAYARSFGATAHLVRETSQFAPALAEALAEVRARRMPALIELACDPRLLSPTQVLAA